jgi:SAM-dependent methyltransferase
MRLRDLQQTWHDLGKLDPLWAILSWPGKRGNRWDPREFFAMGEQEVADRLRQAARWGLPARRREALDFGCGVGRLTQAMCGHFERAAGVDIAPSMVKQARRFNRHGDRCKYHLNAADHLGLFAADRFDFVYSIIVLQHMPSHLALGYLREFVRVLAPGGLLVVQLPSHHTPLGEERLRAPAAPPAPPPSRLRRLRAAVGRRVKPLLGIPTREPFISMYGTPRETVVGALTAAGARVLEVEPDTAAGPEWYSFGYWVTK